MAGDWQLYLQTLSEPGVRIAYEATPLNVHRRHAQSVTHALDVDRHVAEIKRCHAFARASNPALARTRQVMQAAYVAEVADQLGLKEAAKPLEKRWAGRHRLRR